MGWSKIKDMILLLLLIVNVCLLVMVGQRHWEEAKHTRETGEQMVEILKQSNIDFLAEEMPGEMPLAVEELTVEIPDVSLLLTQVGEPEVTGNRSTYMSPEGSMSVTATGQMEARFTPAAHPLNGLAPAAHGSALLETLGVEAAQPVQEEQDGQSVLTYTLLWQGTEVFNGALTLRYEDGALAAMEGQLLTGEESLRRTEELLDAPTALARFLEALTRDGYVCSQITEIYPGYVASVGEGVTLTPVWHISTDAWPWHFAVDALTGQVTAGE